MRNLEAWQAFVWLKIKEADLEDLDTSISTVLKKLKKRLLSLVNLSTEEPFAVISASQDKPMVELQKEIMFLEARKGQKF